MAKEKLNMGVIGIGMISTNHTSSYIDNPRANLYAICDSSETWLPDAKEILKPQKAFHDYNEMLADPDLDAVSICLPTIQHAEATIAALNAGKHVLCEKPMAINAAEARAMHEAAIKSGKKLMISHNQRFEQNVQMIKREADNGFFGEIYFARIGWRRTLGGMPGSNVVRPNGDIYSRNWFNEKDKGGGVLRDLGSHLLDLTMYITGFPELISADASLFRKFYPDEYIEGVTICDSEDLVTAHIKFGKGLTLQLEVSFGSFVEEDVVFTEIYGTKGGASRRNGVLKFIGNRNGCGTVDIVKRYDFISKTPQQRFVDAVIDDTPVPVTSEQGLKVIEILDSIYKSAGKINY
ncbi:MAG: Gfo/Idh/MocA family protein [Saccharofermentanales bacterium]